MAALETLVQFYAIEMQQVLRLVVSCAAAETREKKKILGNGYGGSFDGFSGVLLKHSLDMGLL